LGAGKWSIPSSLLFQTKMSHNKDCIVIVRTGYEKYWGDINKYMGCVGDEDPMHLNDAGWPDNMHWPGDD
jgi:hypothetical protein